MRKGVNFAGQFESFLGLDNETDMLTAVRACWAALWTTTARRSMENHGCSPADTAMAVLIQPLRRALGTAVGPCCRRGPRPEIVEQRPRPHVPLAGFR